MASGLSSSCTWQCKSGSNSASSSSSAWASCTEKGLRHRGFKSPHLPVQTAKLVDNPILLNIFPKSFRISVLDNQVTSSYFDQHSFNPACDTARPPPQRWCTPPSKAGLLRGPWRVGEAPCRIPSADSLPGSTWKAEGQFRCQLQRSCTSAGAGLEPAFKAERLTPRHTPNGPG